MPDFLATVNLPSADGVSENGVVNTFAFRTVTESVSDAAPIIAGEVAEFYSLLSTGAFEAIGEYLSSTLDRTANACQVSVYDITGKLDGSPHGSPVSGATFTLPAALDTSSLPPQVALVMTLRGREWDDVPIELPGGVGEPETIRPRARRSGRLYLGPFNGGAVAAGGSGLYNRPATGVRTSLVAAAEQLSDDLAAEGIVWCVWSRTAENMAAIVRAEVDDSWDVIRSRKVDQTARTVATFSPVPSLALGA